MIKLFLNRDEAVDYLCNGGNVYTNEFGAINQQHSHEDVESFDDDQEFTTFPYIEIDDLSYGIDYILLMDGTHINLHGKGDFTFYEERVDPLEPIEPEILEDFYCRIMQAAEKFKRLYSGYEVSLGYDRVHKYFMPVVTGDVNTLYLDHPEHEEVWYGICAEFNVGME